MTAGPPSGTPRRPLTPILTVSLLLGVGAASLSGCHVVSPQVSPSYAPGPPPPSPPGPPSVQSPGAPRPGGPGTGPPPSGAPPGQPPSARGGAPGAAQDCQTVTVEGHAETLVRQNGQRETVWVPTYSQQVCQ
jgi:hypothetical protein